MGKYLVIGLLIAVITLGIIIFKSSGILPILVCILPAIVFILLGILLIQSSKKSES